MSADLKNGWLSSFNRNRPIEKGLGDFYLNRATYPISESQKKTACDLMRIRDELIELCRKTIEIPVNSVPLSEHLFGLRHSLDGIDHMVYNHVQNPPDKEKIKKEAAALAKKVREAQELLASADENILSTLIFSYDLSVIGKSSLSWMGGQTEYETLDGIHTIFEHVASSMEKIPINLKTKYRDDALRRLNLLYSMLNNEMPKRTTSHKDSAKTNQSGRTFDFIEKGTKILQLKHITNSIIDESIRKSQPAYKRHQEMLKILSASQSA